jgi:CPA2 family monovalent cation:H+ antiporter-2
MVEGLFPLKEVEIPELNNHLVIIGKDATALKLSKMAKFNNLHHVSIVFDPLFAKEKMDDGDVVVYGDAVNEPILMKGHVDTADIVLVSIGSLIPSMAVIEKVRRINKTAYIIARVKHTEDVEQLYKLGADQVLPEKLEIAIDLFNRVLVKRLYPQKEVNRILTHIRSLNLGAFSEKDTVNQPSLFEKFRNMNITAIEVEPNSKADGKSLIEIQLRSVSGVTLLAIKRGAEIIEHPDPKTRFLGKDMVYVLGNPEQVNFASELFSKE